MRLRSLWPVWGRPYFLFRLRRCARRRLGRHERFDRDRLRPAAEPVEDRRHRHAVLLLDRHALGRFGHAVQSVTVRLSDINGPRGGADKLCRIVIQMKSRSIVMEELGNDMRRVIDRLSERVQFNVSRQMEKISRVNRQLMQPPELIPLPI